MQLVLYMTYQPCHHSGGFVSKFNAMHGFNSTSSLNQALTHSASCSERLLDFYVSKLRPHGVGLELVLADMYKATWDEELHPTAAERKVYATKSESAREGMRMLLAEGITMRGMCEADWAFLVSLCDPDVQRAYAQRGKEGSPFTLLHLGLRNAMDAYLSRYIEAEWRVRP